MSSIRVWVNGERLDDKASVGALDHGITVGDGVFETAKVENSKVFAMTRHHDRMDRSLAGLGLPPLDRARLQQGIDAVLAEPLEFGRLRYTITGGPGPLGSDRNDSEPTYIVTLGEAARPAAATAITVVPWVRNERSAIAGLKTTSYAENVVALAEAHKHGGGEAIFANTVGELCEGTGSNIFVVVGDEILTPPLESGPLAGITRALAIEFAREAGITVREEKLPLSVLETCDEAFITSSTRDIQPVNEINGEITRTLNAPGRVTKQAQAAWGKAVADGRE